jgi:S1-C subfamily serine protease
MKEILRLLFENSSKLDVAQLLAAVGTPLKTDGFEHFNSTVTSLALSPFESNHTASGQPFDLIFLTAPSHLQILGLFAPPS